MVKFVTQSLIYNEVFKVLIFGAKFTASLKVQILKKIRFSLLKKKLPTEITVSRDVLPFFVEFFPSFFAELFTLWCHFFRFSSSQIYWVPISTIRAERILGTCYDHFFVDFDQFLWAKNCRYYDYVMIVFSAINNWTYFE
jgi:hypothetical protein